MISIGLVQPDSDDNRDRVLRDLIGEEGWGAGHLLRDSNGKPQLKIDGARVLGYSVSRYRMGNQQNAVMAVAEGFDLGIDAEFWPHKLADPDFLLSIAAPEDGAALQFLAANGRDAGVALWVIKEAALKCSGLVMTDPRHLAVHRLETGMWKVAAGQLAGGPVAEVLVRFLSVNLSAEQNAELLVAIAVPAGKIPEFKWLTGNANPVRIVTV